MSEPEETGIQAGREASQATPIALSDPMLCAMMPLPAMRLIAQASRSRCGAPLTPPVLAGFSIEIVSATTMFETSSSFTFQNYPEGDLR